MFTNGKKVWQRGFNLVGIVNLNNGVSGYPSGKN